MKHCALRAGAVVVGIIVIGFVGCKSDGPKTAPGAMPTTFNDSANPRLNASTYFAHAHLLERQGQYAQAAEQYRHALELNPNFVSGRNRLGITLNKLGRHTDATAQFRLAIQQEPGHAFLYNNLGFSLYLEDRYEEACQAFEQALGIQQDYHRARMNYAVALAKLGRYSEALTQFTMATTQADAYYNMAVIYTEQGQYARAAQSLEKALALNPDFAAAREQLRLVSHLVAGEKPQGEKTYAQGGKLKHKQHKQGQHGNAVAMGSHNGKIHQTGKRPQARMVARSWQKTGKKNSWWPTPGVAQAMQKGLKPMFGPGKYYFTSKQIQMRRLINTLASAKQNDRTQQYETGSQEADDARAAVADAGHAGARPEGHQADVRPGQVVPQYGPAQDQPHDQSARDGEAEQPGHAGGSAHAGS